VTRIGLLYPTRDCGEDDYVRLGAMLHTPAAVELAWVPWGVRAGRLEELDTEGRTQAVRELGEPERLVAAAAQLDGTGVDVAMFTVSSASFLHGLDGAYEQATRLMRRLGVPASSTTLAFLTAVANLGLTRIGLGSVYAPSVTDVFIDLLATQDVRTVHRIDLDAGSDRELAGWGPERILDIVDACDHPDAEALLIPETALHTADLLDQLEERAGKPVLTATQVTMWHALRLAGDDQTHEGLGTLFARAPGPARGGRREQ
jgi:maleate cis-trans isomerase